jgi:hypothetical protein
MSLSIRYKVVGGREGENLCASETDAQEALTRTLEEYASRGYRISHFGDEYIVEDRAGDLVATYELMH